MRRRTLGANLGLVVVASLAACRSSPSANALAAMVESEVGRGHVQEALERVDGVLATEPDRADAWRQRCRCLVLLREIDAALEAVERALAIDGEDAWSHYERGYLLNEMGRHPEALASFEHAIRCTPSFHKAREHRAATLFLLRRPAEAVEEFSAALATWPEGAAGRRAVLWQRAEAWDALGNPAAAADDRALAEMTVEPD